MSSTPEESHTPPQANSDSNIALKVISDSSPLTGHVVPLRVLEILFAFRIINALAVRTFFQPDEYFQALEPAWQLAFGKGSDAWITWEWKNHLRSAIHPAIFATIYSLAEWTAIFFNLAPDAHADLLIAAPKILQAVLAALGDYYTWKLAKRVYGSRNPKAWAALALTVASPWQWFCSTRTLSNCIETTLTIATMYNWPFNWSLSSDDNEKFQVDEQDLSMRNAENAAEDHNDETTRLRRALFLAALATMLRPTNILIWTVLTVMTFINLRTFSFTASSREQSACLRESFLCGSLVLGLSTLVDRLFYQTWTFPPLNFLEFNVFQSLAVFYGNNDWHYYLSQGYPLLLTTALPFAVIAIYQALFPVTRQENSSSTSRSILHQLAVVSLIVPACFSVLTHKEVRFIYPLLPALHILAASPLADFFAPSVLGHFTHPKLAPPYRITKRILLGVLLLLNSSIALYTTTTHNSGLIKVTHYLRHEFESHHLHSNTPRNMTAGLLMPCHSTPWRSYLQYPPTTNKTGIAAWALTCEPPLNLSPSEKSTYLDEADIFYQNPSLWIKKNMSRHPPLAYKSKTGIFAAMPTNRGIDTNAGNEAGSARREWPEYLVFFSALEPFISTILRGSGYGECARFFNSHWHDDSRRTGDVIVWCLYPERKAPTLTTGQWFDVWRKWLVAQSRVVQISLMDLGELLLKPAGSRLKYDTVPVETRTWRSQSKKAQQEVKRWWHSVPGLGPRGKKTWW